MIVHMLVIITQCNKLPTRIRAIASELEQLFKVANPEDPQAPPKNGKPAHKTGPQRPVDPMLQDKLKEALKKFKTPADLANHNCSFFLAKYFLGQDGKPDPSKTPHPVLLPGLSDRLALQQAADMVPGLKTSTGGEGDFRILVIGWNRAAIFEIAEKTSTDQARLRDDIDTTWQAYLRKHYSLIKSLPVSSKPRKFAIESAQGTYAIECRGSMDSYDHDPADSSLRITYSKADGWTGIFRIGVIYGVMRLNTDRKALLARCKATEKNESRRDSHTGMDIPLEEFDTTEVEENASEEEDVFSDLSLGEQDEGSESDSDGFKIVIRRKRRRPPTKAREPSAKRSKISSTTSPHRLYFKWRGREQGEGDVAYDFYKNNAGYLQFIDASCTKFDSTISNALIGKNVRFQGFKISNDGGPVTRTYREYAERAGTLFEEITYGES